MARYYDLDSLRVSDINVGTVMFPKMERCVLLKDIELAPTADVVPKSEVEKLKAKIADLNEKNAGLALACMCDCMANDDCFGHNEWKAIKAKIAREIFEEIEKIIQYRKNEELKRQGDNKMISPFTYSFGALEIIEYQLAELEKKYMED